MTEDEKHLKLLATFHYIVAGIIALMSCLALPHFIIGIMMMTGALGDGPDAPPRLFGLLFAGFSFGMIAVSWTLAGFMAAAAGKLKRREGHTFCLVVAAISCIWMPFGTVLGIFTIIVLMRDSVKRLFGIEPDAPDDSPPPA